MKSIFIESWMLTCHHCGKTISDIANENTIRELGVHHIKVEKCQGPVSWRQEPTGNKRFLGWINWDFTVGFLFATLVHYLHKFL